MTQNRRQSPSEAAGAEPGAARFWGEFSRAGSRRGPDGAETTGNGGDPDPGRDHSDGPESDRADAAASGAGSSRGSARSHDESSATRGHEECLEWCPICRSTELFRSAVTPEIREQAEALQREAVQIFRAFLTAYAERTGGPGSAARSGPSSPGGPDADSGPGPEGPPDHRDRAPESGSDREVTDIPLD